MKILAVEIADACELLPVANVDGPGADAVDEPIGFELLDGPVDVDGGEARGVAELLLGHRQLIAELISEARDLEAKRKFTKQVRDPSTRVAAADVSDPFAENRAVDQGVVPHRAADRRALTGNADDFLTGDHGNLAGSEHLDAMVGGSQHRVLEVDDLPLHVDGDDLAVTAGDNLVAHCKGGKQQAGVSWLVPLADDVMVLLDPLERMGKRKKGFAIVAVELLPISQLCNQRLECRASLPFGI